MHLLIKDRLAINATGRPSVDNMGVWKTNLLRVYASLVRNHPKIHNIAKGVTNREYE